MYDSYELGDIVYQLVKDYKLIECQSILGQNPDEIIERFTLFQDSEYKFVNGIFKVNPDNLTETYFGSVVFDYCRSHRDVSDSEEQCIVLKQMNFGYGRLLIRPENIEDKLIDIFTRQDIDFQKFPVFSSKYYFLADDPQLAKMFTNESRLEIIENQKELILEVNDYLLIAKFARAINYDDCSSLLKFITSI